jgi:excinuclease ABC subunit C
MVVFEDAQPRREHYRKFHIRGVAQANDYAMLQEMLRRRFIRLGEAAAEREQAVDTQDPSAVAAAMAEAVEEAGVSDEEARSAGARRGRRRGASGGFDVVPYLIIVDGGRGQLSAALQVLDELSLGGRFSVVGLAKEHEEIFKPAAAAPIVLPVGSAALHLIQRVRDEAHRFGVTFHRSVRGKRATRSLLDEVPGIGTLRKRALLRAFGSVSAVRRASQEQLMAVPGMSRDSAERLLEHLQLKDAAPAPTPLPES